MEASEAVDLAAALLRAASKDETRRERRHAARLARLLADPHGRELLFALTDEVLRTDDAARAMRRLEALATPDALRALGPVDRTGMRLARSTGRIAPKLVARAVRRRVKGETRGVVLPARDPAFADHLARRSRMGFDANVNLLGEAILGDDEADARLDAVCARLHRADVNCVSVKISALCANLDVLAFDASVERIVERLRRVYRVAAVARPQKLVYLDMEEYRDLHLTVTAFRTALDDEEFRSVPAGIALQAYLPDSSAVLDELCEWGTARHAGGGAPIRVRIVKGANLAMEEVEAELMGWPPAPFAGKPDVDAHYKRMLDRALEAAATGAVHVGVASHNLFDVAWALLLRNDRNLRDAVEIEMLEGMAPAHARAVRRMAGSLLLYTPVVDDAEYSAAIAYLSRRLDENAAEQNFLRALFSLRAGDAAWEIERERFEAAVASRRSVATTPRRDQDRRTEVRVFDPDADFANEPDTDFTLPANRRWIADVLGSIVLPDPPPLVERTEDIDAVVTTVGAGAGDWAATTTGDRRRVLSRAAEVMAAARGRTIAVMLRETGKVVREGDAEASEAIDMARWSAVQTRLLDDLAHRGTRVEPRGVVLVTGPWNFPYAIPANGVVAALAAGNAVLLKPAPEAVATAAELVAQLHAAGVPREVLQLVRCRDDDVGRHLVTHDGIDTVVLTGAYDTARMFLDWKPRLRLIAETSGKNAMVVTGGADLDLAIRDVVRSAYSHSGQKCSAASLAIVEASLYDDGRFVARLADAVRSLRVGPAGNPSTMMGPVVLPPAGKLRRALTQLDPGEQWVVEPKQLDASGQLWSPGLKLGVQPGSWYHLTECFGPVLGVMRARGLDDALALQNAPEFGLTAGLQSLDADEIEHWVDRVEAGNVYVNRHTTGAIVRRQPFGGWKHSSVGPGAKTGGPGDILRFVRCTPAEIQPGRDLGTLAACDLAGLRAEENVLRYRAVDKVVVRGASSPARAVIEDAAARTGTIVEFSDTFEADDSLAGRIAATGATRLRALEPVSDALARACHNAGITVDDTAVTTDGRVELSRYVREQAISRTRHRHGRVPGLPG